MNGFHHVDDYPEIPVSIASSRSALKTGAWRSVRPVFSDATAPCSAGCPAGVAIPAYLNDIQEGRLDLAFATVAERNPFPRITGRVCPHFCEHSCNLAITTGEASVSIRSIERWLGDATAGLDYPAPYPATGLRIAVVGAGPAGLSAAYYLRRSGHEVVVFDRRSHPGGVLRYGIPDYRLPSQVVDAEVARLEAFGVEFRTGIELGTDLQLDDLEQDYAAVFVATGAGRDRPMRIPGESLMEAGLAFLEAAKRGTVSLPGAECAVIGGGNTAVDVARVLRRLGAEVTVLYRRTEAEMPALREEYELAVADGVVFDWLVLPTAVSKRGDRLEVTAEEMALGEPDGSGRPRPLPTGNARDLWFDAVFTATGETADMTPYPDRLVDGKGWMAVDADGATRDPLVYAGGDLATGPATVIEAIVAGRRAARAIDLQLGLDQRWPAEEPIATVAPGDVHLTYVPHHERADDHPVEIRSPFEEETVDLTDAEVLEEIERCLSCGHCNSCGTCFVFCPDGAITWDHGPVFDYEFCKGCGICVAECPGHGLILINERETARA